MNKFVSIDEASIDVAKLTHFLQRGIAVLAEMEANKEDFKELMKEAESDLKLDKKVITAFIKARYKANTKEILAEAEKLEALSNAVDG